MSEEKEPEKEKATVSVKITESSKSLINGLRVFRQTDGDVVYEALIVYSAMKTVATEVLDSALKDKIPDEVRQLLLARFPK